MGQYYVDSVKDGKKLYYIIRSIDDSAIITEPTKYLKHKLNQRRSPNTIRRLAYGLSYYLNYMEEIHLTMQEVMDMKYAEQHEHFIKFLNWLQLGNHCDRENEYSGSVSISCPAIWKSLFRFTFVHTES